MKLFHRCLGFAAGCVLLGGVGVGVSRAQTSPSGGPAPPGAVGNLGSMVKQPASDPVIAEVGGQSIHDSEVMDEIRTLPGGSDPKAFASLYKTAVRRLIDRTALVEQARRGGLADDPAVLRHMQEASDRVLAEAYLRYAAGQLVTESMLLQRYDAEIRGKPGPEEVNARVILVPTAAEAQTIIGKLSTGADFAELARRFSKDPTASTGGDLGFIQRDALMPAVGAVLFSLRAGEIAAYPVPTPVGWFVLQAGPRRRAPTPTFAQARERLKEEAERDAVPTILQAAVEGRDVKEIAPEGSGDAAGK